MISWAMDIFDALKPYTNGTPWVTMGGGRVTADRSASTERCGELTGAFSVYGETVIKF